MPGTGEGDAGFLGRPSAQLSQDTEVREQHALCPPSRDLIRKFAQFLKCGVLVSELAVSGKLTSLHCHLLRPKFWSVSPGDRKSVSLVGESGGRRGRPMVPSPPRIAGHFSSNRPTVAITFKISLA